MSRDNERKQEEYDRLPDDSQQQEVWPDDYFDDFYDDSFADFYDADGFGDAELYEDLEDMPWDQGWGGFGDDFEWGGLE